MDKQARDFGLCLLLFYVFVAGAASAISQDNIDYLADNLQVYYDVITNFRENDVGDARTDIEIRFSNGGDTDVPDNDWDIYMCSIRLLEPDLLLDDPNAVADLGQGVQLEHVQGCLHRFSFTGDFAGLLSGTELKVELKSSDWTVAKTDIMPNWYVTGTGVEPRTIQSTSGETLSFVGEFSRPEQWKRRDYDEYDPYTAKDRYDIYKDTPELGLSAATILPTPVMLSKTSDGTLNVRSGDWVVVSPGNETDTAARYLADKLNTQVVSESPASRYLHLSLGEISDIEGNPVETAEAYKLSTMITGQSVFMVGKDVAGLMHCVQSLLSLEDGQGEVPDVVVVDYPRYPYRGMHADVGRNFLAKEAVLKLLEAMSMYKMNKFHFHLTDDEGWRLEIPGLEELTEVGSKRCHDLEERSCLSPQLGSGPTSNNYGSGYYSRADYREILRFAQDRNIEVIPEFDMPGHGHAPIKAMEARYETYKDSDPAKATEFLLSDPDDVSQYVSIQYFRDNAYNPCMDSAYAFVQKVIEEVKAMHEDIQPLKIFHFGGDEVPHGAWVDSPECQNLLGRNLTDEDVKDLKAGFVVRVGRLVHAEGLELAGWEDGLMDGSDPINRTEFESPGVYGYAWNNIWEWGGGGRAYVLANHNYSVVLAHGTDLYFDHPYEPDPEERGYYWASRVTDTRDTFNYMPDSIYDNIHVTRFGAPLTKEEVCKANDCEELDDDKRHFVKGIQGHLWSETQRNPDQFEFMVFPRMLAVAERGWHEAAWERVVEEGERVSERDADWGIYANTLGYKELARLDQLDINYRVPVPGAVVEEGNKLVAVSQFPGLTIQYSSDDGATWAEYSPGGVSVEPDTTILLRTRSALGLRVSRSTTVRTLPPVSAAPTVTQCTPLITTLMLLLWAVSGNVQ